MKNFCESRAQNSSRIKDNTNASQDAIDALPEFNPADDMQPLRNLRINDLHSYSSAVIPCILSSSFASHSTPSNVMISGTIVKQLTKLLVDTGAAVTVVSENFFTEVLQLNCKINKNCSIDSLTTAD